MACWNTCRLYSSDNVCDDGGHGSEFSACPPCHDCHDCGPRRADHCRFWWRPGPPPPMWPEAWYWLPRPPSGPLLPPPVNVVVSPPTVQPSPMSPFPLPPLPPLPAPAGLLLPVASSPPPLAPILSPAMPPSPLSPEAFALPRMPLQAPRSPSSPHPSQLSQLPLPLQPRQQSPSPPGPLSPPPPPLPSPLLPPIPISHLSTPPQAAPAVPEQPPTLLEHRVDGTHQATTSTWLLPASGGGVVALIACAAFALRAGRLRGGRLRTRTRAYKTQVDELAAGVYPAISSLDVVAPIDLPVTQSQIEMPSFSTARAGQQEGSPNVVVL